MPLVLVAALSCATVCTELLGYSEAAPSLDNAYCRCIDLVDKRDELPIPITLTYPPKKKKQDPERYDDRVQRSYDE